jgi:hypothetical protein
MRRGRSGRASTLYLCYLLLSLQFFFVSGDVACKMDSAQQMRVTLTYHVLIYWAFSLGSSLSDQSNFRILVVRVCRASALHGNALM